MVRVVTFALSLHSASGASVVAIDNKIEQAMVSFPHTRGRLLKNFIWLT